MKRFLTKYGIMLLSLAVVIAVMLSVMTYFSSSAAVFPNLAGIIAAPFRAAGSAITGTLEGWAAYVNEFDQLKEENAALKRRLQELEAAVRQAEYDREENANLRELLDLQEQRRDLSFASARIVEEDYSNWSSIFTINIGTAQGVALGDCVIDETGNLVGVVTEAGYSWSTVRTVLDSETAIGALVFRSGLKTVARGEFSLMDQGRLQLDYLGTEADLMVGDLVVTSGLGDYYPSQLVIGHVEEIAVGDDGMAQYAVVAPSAELTDLKQVFVITDFVIVE